jgi:hypothetical protein
MLAGSFRMDYKIVVIVSYGLTFSCMKACCLSDRIYCPLLEIFRRYFHISKPAVIAFQLVGTDPHQAVSAIDAL